MNETRVGYARLGARPCSHAHLSSHAIYHVGILSLCNVLINRTILIFGYYHRENLPSFSAVVHWHKYELSYDILESMLTIDVPLIAKPMHL